MQFVTGQERTLVDEEVLLARPCHPERSEGSFAGAAKDPSLRSG
ncbi:MAG: hypothetical protein OJF58_004402 [Enhydrobacter sp.]|nr:MAG: hypothetical protein OJF58_004402 [Enhydrobacter sp.]